ncbi:metalloendopeptidase [Trichonephila inaurata madagascariensis]|uniref:Metalloendopeptidase n=1 Tax=Trichonephila inaurata madagascariensis TaxID=2747483 RepID=A0A8X7CP99_9ARAC|nr:metalloendopeptidase [Trichonephila inaurata madagascariensis]
MVPGENETQILLDGDLEPVRNWDRLHKDDVVAVTEKGWFHPHDGGFQQCFWSLAKRRERGEEECVSFRGRNCSGHFVVCATKGEAKKWTMEELAAARFPHKVSNDIYLDPCKSDGFVGDIALSRLENEEYERELEEEKEKEKAEQLAKSLEVSAKNFTDSKAKKRHWTSKKLSKQKLRAQKKLRHSGKNRRKNLVHNRPKRAATARPERLWDRAVIPYDIESNFSGKSSFHD